MSRREIEVNPLFIHGPCGLRLHGILPFAVPQVRRIGLDRVNDSAVFTPSVDLGTRSDMEGVQREGVGFGASADI